jgi:phosphatidate cytidylyltransferase
MASSPDDRLSVRIVSAVVLAAFALAGAWFGGWVAGVAVAAVCAIVHLEWTGVTHETGVARLVGTAAVVASVLALTAGYGLVGAAIVAAAIVFAAASGTAWPPAGIVYAAVLGFGLLLLRLSPDTGKAAIFFVLAVVWGADTGAFFVGRAVGGPKLWPVVSPKKTWSGAVGGLAAGVVLGVIVAALFGVPVGFMLVVMAIALAIAAEAGDLFESWVKRRFGAKDASNLVPGHGGLMDRVDGLTFAAALAALVGWLHGGAGDLAGGVLRW